MSEVPGPFRATALCVVCESYEGASTSRRLVGAREQMRKVAEQLRQLGFAVRVIGHDEDPDRASFRREKEEWRSFWRREGGNGPALILWSGHGELDGRELRLVLGDLRLTGDSFERKMLLREHGITAQQLVDTAMASGADQVLLFVDTCHAGAGLGPSVEGALEHLGQTSLPEGRSKWLGAMASCRAGELSEGYGPLLEAVSRALAEGPRTDSYLSAWSVHNELVTGVDLMAAVRSRWDEAGQTPQKVTVGDERPVFPNPKADPGAPAALVEHLVLAARGVGHREEGWFFTGRRRVLGRIVEWMEAGDPGLFLVTGPAGCGKSAVLGRIATLADPQQRKETERQGALRDGDPDPGERDSRSFVAVHLRGLDAVRAAAELAARLRLRLPRPRSVDAFRAELRELPVPPVVVLDGLDEVPAEHTQGLIEELVFPLSRMVPVLVGSRQRPFRSRLADGETLPQALERYIGAGVVTVDLEREPDTRKDIATYVRRRCEAAEVDGSDVAEALAERATESDGGFLFARLVTGFLIPRLREGAVNGAGLPAGLPESVEAAFEEDLRSGAVRTRDDGTELPSAARDLLTALAWAAGSGMPAGGVWEAVASALGGAAYDEDDVDWVLSAYGRYIVEDGDGAQAVYRLYHREFVSHLREREVPGGADAGLVVFTTVVELFRQHARIGDWGAVDPYVLVFLARHAVWAGESGIGMLRELVEWDENALRYLAEALHDLAAVRSATGDHEAALGMSREAVVLCSVLVDVHSDAYRPLFASALVNLAALYSLTGDRQAALEFLREAVRIRCELARTDPVAHLPVLGGCLNDLGMLLAQTGDDRAALEIGRESARILRGLADSNPAAHLPALGKTLNNLANHLAGNGDLQAALTIAREAVHIQTQLAHTHPAAHLPHLAGSLDNLAGRLADNGDLQAALAPAREAVRIRRGLADSNPAAHLPHLAGSLNNLADRLAKSGDHRAALAPAREAVRLYTRLATDNPTGHNSELATSLDILANRLADNGDLQAALEPCREAVGLRRELARTSPAAHLPGLAVSLNNLANHLARNADHETALDAALEAVDIQRALTRTNRAAHLPGLAVALNNLAVRWVDVGAGQAALSTARETVEVRRELAEASPAAHRPGLAGALSNLACRLAENGDLPAALTPAREAVDLYTRLADTNPAAHHPHLAMALNNLASRLAENGDLRAAAASARESVRIRRELAHANPAAYLHGLIASLDNLADHLTESADTEQAVRVYTDTANALADAHPAAGCAIAYECGAFQLRLPDRSSQVSGLERLVELLVTEAEERPEGIDVRVRRALRSFTRQDRDHLQLFEEVWRQTTATAPPDWLGIPDEVLLLVAEWMDFDTWPESHEFWTRHTDLLSSAEASTALAEYALLTPLAEEYIELRGQILSEGAAPVFRRLHLKDILMEWVLCGSWDTSKIFLEENADLLLDEAADASLTELESPAHTAVLHLARSEGIDAAYDRVQHRDRLQQYVRQAIAEGDGEALAHASALELAVFDDALSSHTHAQAAALLTGRSLPPDPGVPGASATPETRTRLLGELATLSTRPGQDAVSWLRLLQALAQPQSGD